MEKFDRLARLKALALEHAALELRLTELSHHLSLTSDEERECRELKKSKLRLKDTMLHLSRV